jgi:hypothetical protein
MDKLTKFQLALIQIENISKIIEGNEYEKFFVSHLVPIQIEIERQLLHIKR